MGVEMIPVLSDCTRNEGDLHGPCARSPESGGIAPYSLDGPPCPDCGTIMVPTGSCYTCPGCGAAGGCG